MNELIVVGKIAEWQRLKALVLDNVSSPITKRVYNMALDEFMGWFRQEPRPGFTKATVSAWRVSLETRGLGSSSIIIRMSAIRKPAVEAADNGLLAPELAARIARVKSAKSVGIRVGNWLSLRQAQALLSAPDTATLKGLRDRARRILLRQNSEYSGKCLRASRSASFGRGQPACLQRRALRPQLRRADHLPG
jgi:site-specific recombinase XerD